MEALLVLFALFLLGYLLLAPLIALLNASSARRRAEQLAGIAEGLRQQLQALGEEVRLLRAAQGEARTGAVDDTAPADSQRGTEPSGEQAKAASPFAEAEPFDERSWLLRTAQARQTTAEPNAARTSTDPSAAEPLLPATEAAALPTGPWVEPDSEAAGTQGSATEAPGAIDLPEPLPAAARQGSEPQQPVRYEPVADPLDAGASQPSSRPPPPRPTPPPPAEPPAWQQALARGWRAAREWLFGGNLVAKVGLAILFIGVAFLLRHASNYVVVPIEVRLAGIAAGAIALLGWGWRIRLRRPGIALPVQGAALATLMLVVFGAFKLYQLLPAGPTFALLLTLVAFTCILAVLQDALWLAIFGIVGGFAVPILTSTGSGSHVALFSYYALLNAGILAIAWLRAWRSLNVLGFAFTFLIGTAWGVQEYRPEHYASSQAFLILFLLFYVAIAILYARQEAPKLRSYVDGTLVFGVPTVAMGLQYGLVKDFELGAALSALALGLFYAGTASALWRWRAGGLRLLVECFFALAVVFGTLAIPLAFDGRWTSAAWALEGAGITWIGLRQRQPLVWRFGILVQLGSWLAFLKALTGIDALTALGEHFSLGFLLLGATGVFLALLLRPVRRDDQPATPVPSWLGAVFLCVAVGWLLAGLWLEVWLRVDAQARGGLLVLTAFGLVLGLQWLAGKAGWRLPTLLGGIVSALAGLVFLALMFRYMRWSDLPDPGAYSLGEMLSQGGLMGGALLSAAALVSGFGFLRRSDSENPERDRRAAGIWLLLAMFWSAGFALHGLAHLLAWATRAAIDQTQPFYAIGFWPAYGVGLAALAFGWSWLAQRHAFPNRTLVSAVLWPAFTALGGLAFLRSQDPALPEAERWLDFAYRQPAVDGWGSILTQLLGGPLLGGVLLLVLCWLGLRWSERDHNGVPEDQRGLLRTVWLLGLAIAAYLPLLEPLARAAQQSLAQIAADGLGWFALADLRLLLAGLMGWLALQLSAGASRRSLQWLVLPAALLQLLATLVLLADLYLQQRLPTPATGLALGGLWAAMLLCLRRLQLDPGLPRAVLQLAHVGRVIGPWLMLPALLSLNLQRWLRTPAATGKDWIVAGQWGDYLAAWAALALLLLGLRQVRREGWPLAPLGDWYGRLVIPLAALWALLLAIYWNLRQDGSMAPLPYLPLLNPLDISTAFVALLLVDLWRLHVEQLPERARRWLAWSAAALLFTWFNAILLRSAAQYLGLPYRFDALYQSQFVQSMLSITWTLCAFALMQYAVRRLSRLLWIVGACLLAVVVLKLFMVDLKNIGGVARIVSFMGVGGLMLLIGYLAPLPRSVPADTPAGPASAETPP